MLLIAVLIVVMSAESKQDNNSNENVTVFKMKLNNLPQGQSSFSGFDEVNIVKIDWHVGKASIQGTKSNSIVIGEVVNKDPSMTEIYLSSLFAGGKLIINFMTKEVKVTIYGSGRPIIGDFNGEIIEMKY
ncbi:hypothetical protein ABK040_000212 [Willaertia magna]